MRIFLTGGTGSLGRAILRRAKEGDDFTIYSRDEFKQSQLRAKYPQYKFILGDVRDETWLSLAMKGHHLVIHMAAYKHVPQAEINAAECMQINCMGSNAVARAAIHAGVKKVIGISTDKACAPMSMYGASKMIMERIFAQACVWGDTEFNCVRYGNVLGSRGSVVPMFRNQIRSKGEVTITDLEMTRFWLSLDNAIWLIELAKKSKRGDLIIGKPKSCTMIQLADALAGGNEIKVKVIGRRPGERVHERLIHSGEAIHTVDRGNHFLIYPPYTGLLGNVPIDYEYTSYDAERLSKQEIIDMVTAYEEEDVE